MKISVIIPVLNEQCSINNMVGHLLNLDNQEMLQEIIVVDGDQFGSTIGSVNYEDRRVLKAMSQKGRATQMNKGASLAKGDALLFVHADTIIPKNALSSVGNFLNKGYVGGAFSFAIDSKHYFLKFVEVLTNIRSRVTRVPYGDQAIFIEKSVFYEVGGYSDIPILEDVDIMKKLKKKGYKIKIVGERAITSARRWERKGVYKTTFDNRAIMLLYLIGVKPEKLKKKYRGEDMGENCLVIFVRNPEKGKVKTRIAEKFGEEKTLELYKNFVKDILERTASDSYKTRVFVWPPGSDVHLMKTFGKTYEYRHQKGGDLGKRMYHAFVDTFAEGFEKVILIGSDIPQIDCSMIEEGFYKLEKSDAVIGPATDGGYYLIGFHKDKLSEDVFKEIEWGEKSVYRETIDKLSILRYSTVESMSDIDYYEDLINFYKTECKELGEDSYTCKYLRKILK